MPSIRTVFTIPKPSMMVAALKITQTQLQIAGEKVPHYYFNIGHTTTTSRRVFSGKALYLQTLSLRTKTTHRKRRDKKNGLLKRMLPRVQLLKCHPVSFTWKMHQRRIKCKYLQTNRALLVENLEH